MADTLTTTTQVDPAVATYYDRVLLVNAKPELLHERFAQQRPLARKSGNTIKFRRYSKLSTATTPLTEGMNPTGQALSKTDLTATIQYYGDFVHITDRVDMTVEDAVLTEANELLGMQQGETRDEIVRDVIISTASSTNASGGANGNTPTEVTKSDIDAIVKTLLNNDAKMLGSQINASTGVGTSPIRKAFWGIAQTAIVDDLEDVSNFRSVSEYPSQSGIEEGEWGSTGNVRWLLSSVAHASSDGTVQYHLPIIGANAYGITNLEGSMQSIIHDFGSGGTSDPLNIKATAGWKNAFVARILNDNFIHLLKTTHS